MLANSVQSRMSQMKKAIELEELTIAAYPQGNLLALHKLTLLPVHTFYTGMEHTAAGKASVRVKRC